MLVLKIFFTLILMLGVAMTCIPALPGIPFMFLIAFIFAIVDRFQSIGFWHIVIFALITAASLAIDYFSGLIGAKFGGASRKSMLAGFAGLVVGLLLYPPFGAFLGMFVGVFIAEILQFQDHVKAFKAAGASLAAAVTGAVTNVFLALAFFLLFIGFVF